MARTPLPQPLPWKLVLVQLLLGAAVVLALVLGLRAL
jgi:hypothetical protein